MGSFQIFISWLIAVSIIVIIDMIIRNIFCKKYNVIHPKLNDVLQVTCCNWYIFTKKGWRKMTIDEHIVGYLKLEYAEKMLISRHLETHPLDRYK